MKYQFVKRSDGWWQVWPWVHDSKKQYDFYKWFLNTFGDKGKRWDNYDGCFVVRNEEDMTWFQLRWHE